jgi:hypothetical protein
VVRKIESAPHFRLLCTLLVFLAHLTLVYLSVAFPMYTLYFAALAHTLHPSGGYFPRPCDVDCYAFVQLTISVTLLLLLLKF